jgi:NADH-quinone oxidoreductase subunit J
MPSFSIHVAAARVLAETDAHALAVGSAWAVFLIGAGLILTGAFGVILLRNPVHCALMLVITLFGVALEFIDESAYFLAAVQIIVYAGAIVILFLFVIMFLGVDRRERIAAEPFRGQRPIALALGLATIILLLVLSSVTDWTTGAKSTSGALRATTSLGGATENVNLLGQTIYTRYLLPFEMTSALLVIAIVAAVVLARTRSRTAGELTKEEQEELSS